MAQLRSPFPILGVHKSAALSPANRRIEKAHRQVPNIDRIIITWGTAYVFRLKETGKVVANCHKQPASIFDRMLLSVDEIVSWMERHHKIYRRQSTSMSYIVHRESHTPP